MARRGLCGDVFLVGTPAGARIDDVRVETSVRKGRITFDAALADLAPQAALRAPRRDHAATAATLAEFDEPDVSAADARPTAASASRRTGSPTGSGTCTRRATSRRSASRCSTRQGQVARHVLRPAVRLPRVLDRRPRLLPQRHPHLPLRRPARQRRRSARRWPATTRPARAWSGSRASASTSSTRTTTAASPAPT